MSGRFRQRPRPPGRGTSSVRRRTSRPDLQRPALCRRATEPRLMPARRRRARSEGWRSRVASAWLSVCPSSPCHRLRCERQSVRSSAPARQRPTAAHAAPPRCTRGRQGPLAWPAVRRRAGGWRPPPRRGRSRGRRARCPVREARAGGRRKRPWRARWCHAALDIGPRCSSSAMLAGASIVAATSSLVRAQYAAAVRSAAAVSSIEASNSACRSCDGPAPPRPPGQLAAARAYRHEMLSWESLGRMSAFAPAWQLRLRACSACSTQFRVAGRNAAHARSPAPCWRRSAAESSASESCASRMRGSSMRCSLVARAFGIHGGETAARPDQDTLVAWELEPCVRD